MTQVIIFKVFVMSMMWSLFWLGRFFYTGADVTIKNLCIIFAPWIPPVLYFFFFWWG